MKKLLNMIRPFMKDEDGVTAIEYALIGALVAIAIIVGAGALGISLNSIFDAIADKVDDISP